MAIETQPDTAEQPGGQGPARPPSARPWWMRPAIHTGLIGAVLGYLLGHWLGNFLASGYQQLPLSDSNDMPIVLGYAFGVVGWLAGLGVFNDLFRKMAGRPASRHPYLTVVAEEQGKTEPVQVLHVLARPQGRRHPVPRRHDRLLPHRPACSPWRSGPNCCRPAITC